MQKRISLQQNLINHVGFVFDASYSMQGKGKELVAVADDLIAFLKEKSLERNQETRATMYIFGTDCQTACYDIDVLRTPSIAQLYEPTGRSTALIDATLLAIEEMEQTATLHGDHAFLLYILTDGEENSSRRQANELERMLSSRDDNWTIAALVPDRMGQGQAVHYGFSLENTKIWDATSKAGVVEVGQEIRQATDNYMRARSQGVRGTRSLFNLDNVQLTQKQIQKAQKLSNDQYAIYDVVGGGEIRAYVEKLLPKTPYKKGQAFYQLTKTEEIQPNKQIAIRDKTTRNVYTGDEARQMLGIPHAYVKVSPSHNPFYDIFVQSTSFNRKLVDGTQLLLLK